MTPGKHLFEYAILRIVPRVEREEFINAGVILYCKSQKFLQMKHRVDEQKLLVLFPEIDLVCVEHYIKGFHKICNADKTAGAIAQLDKPERFRWLTATRSTIIQCSKVHPGICDDAGEMLEKIFAEQVG
jgi:hypothetical protein